MSIPAERTSSGGLGAHAINQGFSQAVNSGMAVETAAVHALQSCQSQGLSPTTALFNNILGTLARSAPPEIVISWFAKMRDAAVALDVMSCNIALQAHVQRRDLPSATAMLTRMMRDESAREGLPLPSVVSFNTVINGLAQAAEAQKAEALLVAMIDYGLVPPTSGTYATVVAAFARAAEPTRAERWLERMLRETTLTTMDSASEVVGFNATLLAYANASDAAGALRVLEAFDQRARDECPNAKPDIISYNTVISACAKANQPSKAERTFSQMVRAGLEPNLIAYSAVIHAHAHSGDASKAQVWLDRLKQQPGIAADAISYNSVCSAHAKKGDVQAAMACFFAMQRDGVSPSPYTHSIMINALVQSGDAAQAEASLTALVSSHETLTAGPFNALISLYGKQGQPQRAEAVLQLMASAVPRVRPTLVTFNSLANAHAARGDIEATERTLAQAEGAPFHFRLDHYSYRALLQSVSRQREAAASSGSSGGAKPRGSGSAAEAARCEKAKVFARRLWASGEPINEGLRGALSRTLGSQREVDTLHAAFNASPAARQAAAARGRTPAPAAAAPAPSAWGSDRPPRRAASPRRHAGDQQAEAPRAWGALRGAESNSSSSSRPPAWADPSAVARSIRGAPASAPADEEPVAMEEAVAMEEEESPSSSPPPVVDTADDGWTTVPTKRGGKTPQKQEQQPPPKRGGGVLKTIQKSPEVTRRPGRPMVRQASSEALGSDADTQSARVTVVNGGAPTSVRLAGLPMTRSRSERARLLALAESALASELSNPNLDAVSEVTAADEAAAVARAMDPAVDIEVPPPPLPLTRSAASQLGLDLGLGPPIRLTRSAASQLALDVNANLSL